MSLYTTFLEFREVLLEGIWETFYMVLFSVTFGYIIGLPLGILLVVTGSGKFMENKIFSFLFGGLVNIIRSIPFIILITVLIPITRIVMGTAIGSRAAILPLVIACAPFVARMVETIFNELDQGLIDVAKSMGATNYQIITKVMIPESIPALIRSFSITTIMLISFSAMAGAVGAGGLGRIAIRYGVQRFEQEVMLLTIIIIVAIVAMVQFLFNTLALKIDKRVV